MRQVAVPNRTPLRPCHRASRRSRANLEAEAREAKGAPTLALPVNPRIGPSSAIKVDLTMRLSDAGLRCRKTKLIYPDHRLPSWPTEDAAPRSLEPIVRGDRHGRLL